MEIAMLSGTIDRTDRPQVVNDDPLCFHFWKCDPAAYFEYLTSPGNLSDTLEKPSSIACGIEAAIESISKAANTREGRRRRLLGPTEQRTGDNPS
jgi:hypothetical protein